MKNPFLSFVHFIDLSHHLYIHYPGPRWAVVGGYLLTIYLTLPLTPLVTRAAWKLIGRKETGIIISICLIVALIFIILFMYNRIQKEKRLVATLPFLLITGVASNMDNAVERLHLLEYGLLAFLLFRAAGRPRGIRLLWVYVAVLVAGFSDETIQWMLPNRYFDLRDVGMNGIGAAVGLWFGTMIRRPEPNNPEMAQSTPSVSNHDTHRL